MTICILSNYDCVTDGDGGASDLLMPIVQNKAEN